MSNTNHNGEHTMTIKIAKTTYTVESINTIEGGDTCYTLRAGKSKNTKSLIGSTGNWFLWSTQNGMNGSGMPKYVQPIFNILAII